MVPPPSRKVSPIPLPQRPAMPFYGRERFDPSLILAQIIILQSTFYLSLTALLLVFDRVLGVNALVSAQVFDHRALTLREFGGWVTSAALLIANIPTAFAYVAMVGRSKRSLDFACTIFIAHLIATILHSGMPASLTWWGMNAVSVMVLVVLCEFMCMRIEMQDIQVSSSGSSSGLRKVVSPESPVTSSDERGRLHLQAEAEDLEDPLLERRR
jgi:protein SYS1